MNDNKHMCAVVNHFWYVSTVYGTEITTCGRCGDTK